jgi:hypothetical protein
MVMIFITEQNGRSIAAGPSIEKNISIRRKQFLLQAGRDIKLAITA